MTSKLRIVTIGFAALLFAHSSAWACFSGSDVSDLKFATTGRSLTWEIRTTDPPGPPITIEIDGLTAVGAEQGDSCVAAPMLPKGLVPKTIYIVHAETGKPLGFGPFRANARVGRGFCGEKCVAFVSRVTRQGIKAGTPLKMIIEASSKGVLDARQLTHLAVRLARTGLIVAGGADEKGSPHHHVSVLRPSGIEIVFPGDPNKS